MNFSRLKGEKYVVLSALVEKYKFPTLSEILKVKVGTKYVWEERVRQQSSMVHLLEDVYGIKLNMRAFSFYPNYLYFGMPITNNPRPQESAELWVKIKNIWEKNRWKVYAAFEHVDPNRKLPNKYDSFDDLGFDHVQLLLSELVLLDLNYTSLGVGQQTSLSLFQPMIGFAKGPVSRMITGRPGGLILRYEKDENLVAMMDRISKRRSFHKEPFYVRKNSIRKLKSVYKGKTCLNELILM